MISFCGHTPLGILLTSLHFISTVSSASVGGRWKRNVGQLVSLVVKDTPYKFTKLANYGNWCGKGGDLMGDGSVTDGCDACCKHHDKCYHKTRLAYPGCNPILTVYEYRHGQNNPSISDQPSLSPEQEWQLRRNLSLPACKTDENEGPDSCTEATCQCDIQFIMCLKREPCNPQKVNEISRFWWIPW